MAQKVRSSTGTFGFMHGRIRSTSSRVVGERASGEWQADALPGRWGLRLRAPWCGPGRRREKNVLPILLPWCWVLFRSGTFLGPHTNGGGGGHKVAGGCSARWVGLAAAGPVVWLVGRGSWLRPALIKQIRSSSPLNSESLFKIHTCVGRLNPVWEDGMLGGGGDRMSLSLLPM